MSSGRMVPVPRFRIPSNSGAQPFGLLSVLWLGVGVTGSSGGRRGVYNCITFGVGLFKIGQHKGENLMHALTTTYPIYLSIPCPWTTL